MGLFGRKKEEPTKDIITENPVFGSMKLSPTTGWFSVETKTFVLWDKEYDVKYAALIDTPDDTITAEQEESCKLFQEELEGFKSLMETALEERFASQDIGAEALQDALHFSKIYFSRDGEIGIPITTDLDSDILEWCDIGPDNEFGIMLHPEIRIIPNNEEFTEVFFKI